jgi:lipopolysaccharide transport system permease protein
MKITIFEPNQRIRMNHFQLWKTMFQNIFCSRELIWQLFKRDFLMAYKKSFLGMAWIVIAPIIGIVSWVLMNASGILAPGDVGVPYPAYVLFSSSIWGLFIGIYSSSLETLNAGSAFILQVRYPHEALLVKQIAQQIATFTLSLIINFLVLAWFGIAPSWKIIFFPFLIFPLFLLAGGLGLFFSVVNVVASDIAKGSTHLLSLLMFVTPVIYSNKVNNETLQAVMKYNPLTYLIGVPRDLVLLGDFGVIQPYLYSSLFALIVFILSWRFFYITEDKVIEKMI